MEYIEIIKNQMSLLPSSIRWWPKYFYHFTDIKNALGIIDKGWIYGRQEALVNNLMETDNASQTVISVSQNKIQEYARLYFRPRTPTQYHNEGYKPECVRNIDFNANCPVPVFFFLDSVTVLNIDGVKFSETSCAGYQDLNLLSGITKFAKLPFSKIYHDGSFSPNERDDIVKHRHAEIVRLNGLPIKDAIKGIVCRSIAEKQTLLYLLKTQYPQAYYAYRSIIRYAPELNLFFNNGIFIKTVEYTVGRIKVEFNDPNKRYGRYISKVCNVKFEAVVHYINEVGDIINRVLFIADLNYTDIGILNLEIENPDSKVGIIEITLDGHLMYKNILDMKTEDLL